MWNIYYMIKLLKQAFKQLFFLVFGVRPSLLPVFYLCFLCRYGKKKPMLGEGGMAPPICAIYMIATTVQWKTEKPFTNMNPVFAGTTEDLAICLPNWKSIELA